MAPQRPVVIIGAGTIGLATGWELARQGRAVTLIERGRAGRGTSWLAAGMLAPDCELQFEELALYGLNKESLSRWPGFVQRLEAASGLTVDYRSEGTLIVADDADSAAVVRRLYQFQKEHGLAVEWLSGADALDREPFLAPRLAAAVYAPGDHQVDNRRLLGALKTAFVRAGGVLHEDTPVETIVPDAEAPAVVTASGDRIEASVVIVAAGVWSRGIGGLDPDARPPVRPLKGQMLELKRERPFDLRHVVRGPDAYIVPKSDGRILIGATSEEMGFDTTVTAGGLYRLLEGAWEVVPGIYDLPVTDTWAGLRPASRDHAPLLGASAEPGVVFAAGHYRHGILLTPVTAEEIARFVLTGETSSWLAPFSPLRFSPTPSASSSL